MDDVIGIGLVFPGTGAEEGVGYVSADLSRLGMTPEDLEVSEDGDPDADESSAVEGGAAS